jgi:predicted nucleic-acid-binding Zn-ribbon protein
LIACLDQENAVTTTCPKCGAGMEDGFTTATASMVGVEWEKFPLIFVVHGTPTARSPIGAFKQGTADEAPNRPYQITGVRCRQCGFLELYANDAIGA